MKQWTEDDLILLYYKELEPNQERQIKQVMAESNKHSIELRLKYDALCEMLNNGLELEVPEPRADLNQQIMLAINAAESQKRQAKVARPIRREQSKSAIFDDLGKKISSWLTISPGNNLRPAFMLVLVSVVGVFYLGRLSVVPVDTLIVQSDQLNTTEQSYRPSGDASRRVLLTNVSSHLESGQRLLTLVSNGGNDLSVDIEPRREMIEQLIGFNRLYRRMAEQSDDKMLVTVLEQMESILLEISHTQSSDDDAEWEKVRKRLDGTDILFKLKVTDKKINRELI